MPIFLRRTNAIGYCDILAFPPHAFYCVFFVFLVLIFLCYTAASFDV